MNKNLLIIILIISLFTGGYSVYQVYKRINLHLYGDSIEIRPQPAPPAEMTKNIEDKEVNNVDNNIEEKKQDNEKKIDKQKENIDSSPKAIKTLFEYKNPKAKKVSLTGSFLKWKEAPMKNKNGVWTKEVYILPGNYFYHFIVDGKKTLDNKNPKTPMGESLVMVK